MRGIERFWLTNNIKKYNGVKTWKEFRRKSKDKKIILAGGGVISRQFIEKYSRKYNIYSIIDSNPVKWGNTICGVKIISDLELKNIKSDFLILITSTNYNEELKNKFEKIYGDKVFSLFDMEIDRMWHFKWAYRIKQFFTTQDGIFRSLILFNIFGLLRVLHFPGIYKENEKRIEKLKNSKKGKRCFIIAPGPSLTKDDILKLDGEFTFAVNKVFKIYEGLSCKPNYYALLDSSCIPKYRSEECNFDVNECASDNIFLTHLSKKDIIEKNSSKILYVHTSHLDHATRKYSNPKLRYSNNIIWGHHSANTVTNFAINIAAYMGFKEIYLLGVDCNYVGDKQYFDNSKNPNIFKCDDGMKLQNEQMIAYEFIKKETEKQGVKVYNATRGGALEVFERVDFDSLFKEEKDV